MEDLRCWRNYFTAICQDATLNLLFILSSHKLQKKTQLINPLLKDQMNQSETISPGQGPLTHVKHGKAGNGLLEVLWRMKYPGTWKSHCLSGTTISNQSDTVPPPPLCINEAGNLAFAGCRSRHFSGESLRKLLYYCIQYNYTSPWKSRAFGFICATNFPDRINLACQQCSSF